MAADAPRPALSFAPKAVAYPPPPPLPPVSNPDEARTRLAEHLHRLVAERAAEYGARSKRPALPPLEADAPRRAMWVPLAGMYGGFALYWAAPFVLDASSWSRVVGGSGERHLVRPDGAFLVERGFV